MEHIESAYLAGVAEAERDIVSGQLKLRYGARSAWGEDLASTLRTRFNVEMYVQSCFVTDESSSFVDGYNATVEAHINAIHGPESVAAVWDEIQRRRKAAYDTWVAENRPSAPDDGATAL